jgi:gliding motility-associated-like protein
MKKLYALVLVLISFLGAAKAQNTLIASEDFENTTNIAILNTTGVGTNSGSNKWIVNNQYSGGGIYPNTISQDSTFGGIISNANGRYLHIHDSIVNATNGVANANYAPLNASDRFTIVGNFCTLGFTDVTFAFYFTCEGDSNNAFGELYFSANNGPWQLATPQQFRNRYKWKYEEVQNTAFNNLSSLRFGFRWTNNSVPATPRSSFSVDHIRLVGNFNSSAVGINIDSVITSPVCQGSNLIAFYSFNQPLCGLGFYQFELSNMSGSFNNPTNLGIFQLNNLNLTGSVIFTVPANTQPGTCYRIRIVRIDLVPAIVGDTSACVSVIQCANTITTLMPIVLSNPLDTICVGSVIDIPFFSTGVFTNNTYVAQLSDSAGNFPFNANVLGTFPNSQTYDPAQGSLPGSVSGLIEPQFHPIPPGCNYYIRVVSTNPAAIGSVYGPFCIRNCDIITNNKQDVQACLSPTQGFDTLITVSINTFDSTVVYNPGNQFQIQVLSSQTFAIINTGVIGSVQATGDTTIQLSLPVSTLIGTVGLGPGMYYMRVVATSSNQSWNTLGTLVRLTIGIPFPNPISVLSYNPTNFTGFIPMGDSTLCVNNAMYFTLSPFNPASQYQWTLNNNNWSTEPSHGILFNSTGNFTLQVVETNYGCVGPGSSIANITVNGPPNTIISGPNQICEGDTGLFSVQLQPSTFYSWTSVTAQLTDTLNNQARFYFPNSGTITINIQAINECGTSNNTRNVLVRPLPIADAGPDLEVCPGEIVSLNTPKGNGYLYLWKDGVATISTDSTASFIAEPNGNYMIDLTVRTFPNINGGCISRDTVFITVKEAGPTSYNAFEICEDEEIKLQAVNSGDVYQWNTGAESSEINTNQAGLYFLVSYSSLRCPAIDSFFVSNKVCEKPERDTLFIPNVFSPNGDNSNDRFKLIVTNVEALEVIIYNRWGQIVSTFNNAEIGWDGRHYKTGQECSHGTYYYLIKLKRLNRDAEVYQGFLTLLR